MKILYDNEFFTYSKYRIPFINTIFQQKKTEARMSAAVILLSNKNKSITSIAEELGYSSAEHFSSAFHKYYEMSPREYRKHMINTRPR